jgi:hypothetical protein
MPGDDLRRRVGGLPWPKPADHETAEPATGEIWRASWGGTSLLVLITGTSEAAVTVAAMTAPETGDEQTLVLTADASPLHGVPFHVWLGVRAELPIRALDERIGSVPDTFMEQVRTDPGGGFAPITSALDDRAGLRADLEERIAALTAAEWQPTQTGPALRDLVGVRPGQLAKAIGILPGDATQIYERRRPLDDEAVQRVAATFNLEADAVVAATTPQIPSEILSLFDHPRRCRLVRRRARQEGTSEVAVMHSIADPLAQMAARTTGHEQPDWESLIDSALAD